VKRRSLDGGSVNGIFKQKLKNFERQFFIPFVFFGLQGAVAITTAVVYVRYLITYFRRSGIIREFFLQALKGH